MKDQLLLDLDAELGTVSEVETVNLKFEKYDLRIIDGKCVVVGVGKIREEVWSNFKKYDLLFSIFDIITGPLPRYFNPDSLRPVMPDDTIIKWCQAYGLPYIAQDLRRSDRMISGFRTDVFRYRLAVLYSYFLLWKALIDGDREAIDLNMLLVGLKPEAYLEDRQKILETKKSLAMYISRYSPGIFLSFDKEQDKFSFRLEAKYPMDVCYYQLATLTTLQRTDIHQNLKVCGECGHYFWGHGNRVYCNHCDRRTVWSRQHRKQSRRGGEYGVRIN